MSPRPEIQYFTGDSYRGICVSSGILVESLLGWRDQAVAQRLGGVSGRSRRTEGANNG